MDNVLVGIKGIEALVYLDDIIVFSPNIHSHAGRLSSVFSWLKEANLCMQLEKCVFGSKEVEYLGHIVSSEGVKPDPKKVQAVKNYPVPKTVRDVRSFVGLVGYYRRFIKHFSDLAKPLTELTRKNLLFKWGKGQGTAFDTLWEILCMEPILKYPDFQLPFLLSTDASGTAIGTVLS